MFVKTHKCASSSVQNVLLRYGNANNLTFVIPPFSNNLGDFTKFELFVPNLALPPPPRYSPHYDIFAHHARYNRKVIPGMMPKDTVYISILRDPVEQYRSIWNYDSLTKRFKVSLENFVANPRHYYFRNPSSKPWFYRTDDDSTSLMHARNPMMSDLGLEKEDFDNLTSIQEAISYIASQFSLIMLSDQMDESLVLLRALLCWEWDDVIEFHLNRQSANPPEPLSDKVTENILAWNYADNMLLTCYLIPVHSPYDKASTAGFG
ncbi:galactosylceramide sulfotransferase-like [Paramacrobiotus metropolitanus]|uniref:galactosylceramide sulfotransferase-like n=1 Tax=Paramacrobiotus metropolitanus TaxID=2943436 RepID=UPI002445612D|nr:galactosylceramide sulfotransferase-like [Paramacrobiotus metropolitanus]